MYSLSLLEKGCYYLIQEKEEGPVGLIRVNLGTDRLCIVCVQLCRNGGDHLEKKGGSYF